MLPINYDYSDLVKQLYNAGREFSKCKTLEERFVVYETYLSLADSFFNVTGKEFCNKKLYRSFLKEGEDFFLGICASNFNNFLINKQFHADIMLACYQQLNSFFEEFDDNNLKIKKLTPIKESRDEDNQLLRRYFNEKSPELGSLYDTIVSNGNLYLISDDDWLREGLSIFNLVQRRANLFVRSYNPSFKELSIVPHELGHVLEFYHFLDSYSVMDILSYFTTGCLSEVVSTYYEQQFLDFYMNNGDRCDDAILAMQNHFARGLNDIWDSYVLASLSNKTLEEIQDNNVELSSVEMELMNSEVLSPSLLSDENRIIGITISPVYAYGFLLANYFLENPDSYSLFLKQNNQEFSPEFLNSIGITNDSLAKTLVKRSNTLLKKYMD